MKILTQRLFFLFALQIAVNAQVVQEPKSFPSVPSSLMKAELIDLDGQKFRLDDYRGKIVVLNLWATWSAPCRTDFDDLVKLQTEYRHRGLEIIGLNIGDGTGTPENVRAMKLFAGKLNVNFYLAQPVDIEKTTETLYSFTKQPVVPQTILIDGEGRLRGVFVGSGHRVIESRKELVTNLLNQNP